MMKLSDIQIKDNPENLHPDCDLSLLVGKSIKRVLGYMTDPFETVPIFLLTHIEFEDGSKIRIQADSRIPYIPAQNNEDKFPTLTEDVFMNLYCEQNPEQCEDELEG